MLRFDDPLDNARGNGMPVNEIESAFAEILQDVLELVICRAFVFHHRQQGCIDSPALAYRRAA